MVFIIAAMGSHNFLNFYEHPQCSSSRVCSTGKNIGCIIKDPRGESGYTLNYMYHVKRHATLRYKHTCTLIRPCMKIACIEKNVVQFVSSRWCVSTKLSSTASRALFSRVCSSVYRLKDKNNGRALLKCINCNFTVYLINFIIFAMPVSLRDFKSMSRIVLFLFYLFIY